MRSVRQYLIGSIAICLCQLSNAQILESLSNEFTVIRDWEVINAQASRMESNKVNCIEEWLTLDSLNRLAMLSRRTLDSRGRIIKEEIPSKETDTIIANYKYGNESIHPSEVSYKNGKNQLVKEIAFTVNNNGQIKKMRIKAYSNETLKSKRVMTIQYGSSSFPRNAKIKVSYCQDKSLSLEYAVDWIWDERTRSLTERIEGNKESSVYFDSDRRIVSMFAPDLSGGVVAEVEITYNDYGTAKIDFLIGPTTYTIIFRYDDNGLLRFAGITGKGSANSYNKIYLYKADDGSLIE